MTRIPVPLLDFLDLYRRGEFWESHEVLEGPWRTLRSDFYQGLILYASAWVHWERGNAHGVRAQCGKALDRLGGYPDAWCGIDVDAVREHCIRVREVVADDSDGWAERITPLALEASPRRIRGNEPELPGSTD